MTRIRKGAVAVAILAVVATMGACSSGAPGDGGSEGTTAPGTATGEPTGVEAGVELTAADLPEVVQEYYGSYDTFTTLYTDPYADWQAPEAPLKFCLNDSFQGNEWRQQNLAELQRQVELYRAAGLADGELLVTNSDGDITLQVSQFNSLVNQGCDVIISIPGSPTALCDAFASAHDAGVLVVTDEAPTHCSDAINVSWNSYWAQKIGVEAVMDKLGGKGNVISVEGIAGAPTAVATAAAVADVLAQYPDVKLLGTVAGNWAPAVTKTEMTKFLATHPEPVDAVFDAGAEAVASLQALESAGRPLALVNSHDGSASFFAYWKAHPEVGVVATNQSPRAAAYETLLVVARKIAGQQLVTNTVLYPVPVITAAELDDWYDESMTVESSSIPTPPDGRAAPDSYFDAFFTGGSGDVTFMPEAPAGL